ncbi:hypothetical protein H6G81_04890 [Scytonema hofmannii FACHB-248]|uniref:Lipoprotein n=1 Tax=Scytonema hofmannii FACHB-248 TaxID=1842502 RepID=A0ABR8GKG7_9CYAN|nr:MULTISPECIES: hypothetical protein [Nostocales]MBD2603885.1 hypothetical protein [Scytonema hofmannii FACHB-248]
MPKLKLPKHHVLSSSPVSKPPSCWMSLARWFRFGLGVFLLLSLLLGTVGCSSSAATVSWQEALSVVSVKTLEQIVQQNTELDPTQATADVLAWTVKGKAEKLVVLDYNNSGVCGAAGCLYNGYLISKNEQLSQVFSSYLNPYLPQHQPLFQVGNAPEESLGVDAERLVVRHRSDTALPCLQVMQVDNNRLRQMLFCFNGQNYQLTSSQLIDKNSK